MREDDLAMTRKQYDLIMIEIWGFHRFSGIKHFDNEEISGRCKYIKYVRPNWDMRDGKCFSIRLDGLGCGSEGKEFTSGYGQTVPLYEQVMKWLMKSREAIETESNTADRQHASES